MANSRYDFQKIIRSSSGDVMSTFNSINVADLQSETDIFVRLQYGQRIDNLAYKYVGNGSYWWVICLLNGFKTPFDQTITTGKVVRVPTNVARIFKILENANA